MNGWELVGKIVVCIIGVFILFYVLISVIAFTDTSFTDDPNFCGEDFKYECVEKNDD